MAASHLTAAALAGFATPPDPPHIIVSYGRSSRSTMAVVHRARLHPIDRTTLDGVPATTVPRTLVDCAGSLSAAELERLVNAAMHQHRWLTARSVQDAWERSQRREGRRGRSKLEAALADWQKEIAPGSPAELRLIRMLVQWGFPLPERQVEIIGATGKVIARVDVGWPLVRVGIEYDSDRWHGPERRAADERRHQAIDAAGWTILRADKADLRAGERTLRDALERAWRLAASRAPTTDGS